MNLLKNLQKYFVILVVLLIFGGNSVYANDAGSGDSSEETLMKVKELNVNIVELDETLSAATGDFVIASKPLLQRIQVGGGSGIGSARSGGIKNVYTSIKNSPNYPNGFVAVQNGTRKVNVKNQDVLAKLREVESGKWYKVYKDGYDVNGKKISIHYFQSSSGKVFDVKVKNGWSNK